MRAPGHNSVREFEELADYQACLELQRLTWGDNFDELVPATVIKLAQRLGGIAAGAFDASGRLLGFVFGMTGPADGSIVHWSDMMAVHPDFRNQGIGEALKRYQRDRMLGQNVQRMHWTFDPLEARNAQVNFARLGAIAREYVRDLYGGSTSPLHAGIGTDRLIVTWQLDSKRVADRLAKGGAPFDRQARSATEQVIPVQLHGGVPMSGPPRLDLTSDAVRISIPSDIQTLKRADPGLARQWRQHTRAGFEHYLAQDYWVMEFEKGSECGSYVLGRRPLLA
ncbi:MAG: GNAT family N-acetyltransferase [Longimicrobiales bacterium]